jgi:uncharacterized damage-inducible protein DinB
MRTILIAMLSVGLLPAQPAPKKPATLRDILLEQLHTTHDKEDWFVPINIAVEGLTPEQAKWTDGKGNHSVGQLANHLVFWNARNLATFKGEKPGAFSGNNDETFNSFDAKTWKDTVARLDSIMKAWEEAVRTADDAKIAASASQIAHIGAHNAYHVGQIIYVRKLQGVWDPSKGVK